MFLKNLKVKNIIIMCIENAKNKENGSVLINRQPMHVYFSFIYNNLFEFSISIMHVY